MSMVKLSLLEESDNRLRRRLAIRQQPTAIDVLPLLRTAAVKNNYATIEIDLEIFPEFDEGVWRQYGFTCAGDSAWRAEPWLPTWLDHHGQPPDYELAKQTPRRPNWAVAGDPFFERAIGRPEYLSTGQRTAVRAVASAGPGSVVLVVLPTGSGKTEVALSRIMTSRPLQSVIVTPTVSLALDLERRVRELAADNGEYAYYSGLTDVSKVSFADRIRDGSQWLTIASPEALCTALSHPLEIAASEGRLGLFAVDEAHMVAEWGEDFRPEFQMIAGLRRRLLEIAPPERSLATVLLTATLDDSGVDTLKRLFDSPETLLISAQATRPEPAWWSQHCDSEEVKRARFLELVRHLPRPIIVYTTLNISARSTNTARVLDWLKEAGVRATSTVVGGASAQHRTAAVRGLRLEGDPEDDLDVIVATSAFGLGIDIPNVRAVIHLCVPESIDRLYQEVGRGGRDGKASASFVLWTDEDAKVASDMSAARLIGDEFAWRRWQKLRHGQIADGVLHVDLTSAHEDVKYPWSDANVYWNIQTLSAMDRAGMISLDWKSRLDISGGTSEESIQDELAAHRRSLAVRLIHGNLADEVEFRRQIREAQRSSRITSSASQVAAERVLDERNRCTNALLAERYRLENEGDVLTVDRQCGGCPWCRAQGVPAVTLRDVAPARSSGRIAAKPDRGLRQLARDNRICVWGHQITSEAETELVTRLADRGVKAFYSIGSAQLPTPAGNSGTWWFERVADYLRNPGVVNVPSLVRVDVTGDFEAETKLFLSVLPKHALTVVLTTSTQSDPFDNRMLLRETWGSAYSIDHLLARRL